MMTKKTKDTTKCKEWERQRRDRLNLAFDGLAQLLPFYDPAKAMTKIEILEKSAQFIKEIRLTNSRLLVEKCQPQETSKKVHQLQEEVNKLIIRVKQLTLLLKQANIAIPLGPSIKLLGKRKRKWSTKLISQENGNSKMKSVNMMKTASKGKKRLSVVKKNVPKDLVLALPGQTEMDSSDTGVTEKENATGGGTESPFKEFTSDKEIMVSAAGTSTVSSCGAIQQSRPATTSTTLSAIGSGKLIGPLSQSNMQNVQPIITTGMPLTISLSSTLTPVTFSGQLGLSNVNLQLRPTILFTSPITCSLPQSSTASVLDQMSTNTKKLNESSLNILPKFIFPSCSLQKIPIKCIRKAKPRKKYLPRGNSKKRLELKLLKEREAAEAEGISSKKPEPATANQPHIESTEMQSESNEKLKEPARSPSPELIDISQDQEDEHPQATQQSELDKDTSTGHTRIKSPTDAAPSQPQTQESIEPEKISSDADVLVKQLSSSVPERNDSANNQVSMNSPSNQKDPVPTAENTILPTSQPLNADTDKKKHPEVIHEIGGPRLPSTIADKALPGALVPTAPESKAQLENPVLKPSTSSETTTNGSLVPAKVAASNEIEKTPTKSNVETAGQSCTDLRRLLEEEDVSLSSEDKISECIARSIGLIDDHPACTDLIELSNDWSAVVNSHLAAKSPISPTQMFLSMFPLLPRDGTGLMSDSIFGQKTTAGLLGCNRSAFGINPMSVEDSTSMGITTPSSGEPLTLTGVDSIPYSWAQPQFGETSSIQSKFGSLFSSQRPSKRSSAETSQSQVSNSSPKSSKNARGDKQTAQPLPAPSASRNTNLAPNNKISVPRSEPGDGNISTSTKSQGQNKTVQSKRSRKSSTSKPSAKISNTKDSASSSDSICKVDVSKTQELSNQTSTKTSTRHPLQSPPTFASPLTKSVVITSPKPRDVERESQFMPFRSLPVRSSGSIRSNQETHSTSTTTSFLPTFSSTTSNLPFELFRPAASVIPSLTSLDASTSSENNRSGGGDSKSKSAGDYQVRPNPQRKDAQTTAYGSHGSQNQFQPQTQQCGDASPYACTFDDGNRSAPYGPTQGKDTSSAPGIGAHGSFTVSTAQHGRPQIPAHFGSYNLDMDQAKSGHHVHKTSKTSASQHFPFYLPEPSISKRSEAYSECTPNYTYQQHTQAQAPTPRSLSDQPDFFLQEPNGASLYQPAPPVTQHSGGYHPAHSSTNNVQPQQGSPSKSSHSHAHVTCASANYLEQHSSRYQQEPIDSFRSLSDLQHCSNSENTGNASTNRFVPAPIFAPQRHPTVNWMTDPTVPSANPQSVHVDYSNVTAPNSKKSSRNSNQSNHTPNPFSVSTLMGNAHAAPAPGAGNNYCTEAIIRKSNSSSWNQPNFGSSNQIPVSKPEVSATSGTRGSSSSTANYNTSPSFNSPNIVPHQHHLHHSSQAQAQASPHSHSHSRPQFSSGPSNFNYFENTSSNIEQTNQSQYAATTSSTSTSQSQIFHQQHPVAPASHVGQPHYHHPHAHQHHCHPSSSSSVTNFNLSTIFPEINDKRIGNLVNQNQGALHGHSQHQASNNGSQSSQQQQHQQSSSSNQPNNFSYFVNNLTPK